MRKGEVPSPSSLPSTKGFCKRSVVGAWRAKPFLISMNPLALIPMDPSASTTDTAVILTQRAQALLDLGRASDAIPVLLQALSQAPDDHRTLCLLALAHGKAGRAAEAVPWADQAVKAAPDHEWGHRLRAIYLLERGQTRPALRAAEEAARLSPEYPETLHTLAHVQLKMGRRRDAQATAERMRTQAPDSFLTHEMLTLIAMKRERWRDAEAHCRHALALRPNAYHSLNNLGVALMRQANPLAPRVAVARFVEAIACLGQAVRLSPAERLARGNRTAALSRYLLLHPLLMICAFSAGVLGHAGDMKGPPGLVLGLATAAGVAVVYCVTLGVLRFRSLPPDARAWLWREWRRRRRDRRSR